MIKTHKELSVLIEGKNILHMNSLGKDSVLVLEYLTRSARPSKIFSIFYSFFANHPHDARYMKYLKKRYPSVVFMDRPNTIEINLMREGTYQSPLSVNYDFNQWEYSDFQRGLYTQELKKELQCDFIAAGFSKYEGFARASKFYKEGLVKGDVINPLGLMNKVQIYDLIKRTGIKLHPCYKTTASTYDHISYWKMRAGMIANPEFKNVLYKWFPLLRLDEYRFEVLFENGKNKRAKSSKD